MIRGRRVDPKKLSAWLSETLTGPSAVGYSHRLLEENGAARAAILDELGQYARAAHDDALQVLRKGLAPTLAPFATPEDDPAFGYPGHLHADTLRGYLGEVLAALLVENKAINSSTPWVVPAFFFRFHRVAFQKLQSRRDYAQQQLGTRPLDSAREKIPGRTGNDVLAFLLAQDGALAGLLVCEAKCLSSHVTTKAKEAHAQLVEFAKNRCPPGVAELIEALGDDNSAEAVAWRECLREFYYDRTKHVQKADAVVYVTGNKPKRKATWIDETAALPSYTGSGPLEVVEVHIDDLGKLVDQIYRTS